jgi:hypothetical protein
VVTVPARAIGTVEVTAPVLLRTEPKAAVTALKAAAIAPRPPIGAAPAQLTVLAAQPIVAGQ